MSSTALEGWTELHETAVLLHIGGRSNTDIASALGRSEEWVKATISDERALVACEEFERRIVEQVASRGSEIQLQLRAHAAEALDKLLELLRFSVDEKIVFKAATAILDRAGFTAVQRSINVGTQLPAEVADRIEQTMRDMSTIDAEYEIIPMTEKVADA